MSVNKTRQPSKTSRKEKIIIIISIVLILISLVIISGAIILNWKPLNNDPNNGELDQNIATPDTIKDKSVNLLICGIDEDEDRNTKLTDVIMLLNFDIVNKKMSILQIPRDTFVGTDKVYTGKINGIYSAGKNQKGIEGLSNVINTTFSLPIDYYFTITMEGFRKVIDSIGGVEVDVPQAFSLEGVKIPAGKQVLYGEQAEKFVRVRSIYNDGDIGRVIAQRTFLAALAQKLKSTSLSDMIKLIPELSKNITSDMTVSKMISFYKLAHTLDLQNIDIHMLPGEATLNGNQSVYSLHKDKTAELLNSYFRPHSDIVTADNLKIIELKNKNGNYDNTTVTFNDIINNTSSNSSSE